MCALRVLWHTLVIQIKCKKTDLLAPNWSCSQQQRQKSLSTQCQSQKRWLKCPALALTHAKRQMRPMMHGCSNDRLLPCSVFVVLGYPQKWCAFAITYIILPTRSNQLYLNPANLKATAAFLHLVCFDVVVAQQRPIWWCSFFVEKVHSGTCRNHEW